MSTNYQIITISPVSTSVGTKNKVSGAISCLIKTVGDVCLYRTFTMYNHLMSLFEVLSKWSGKPNPIE